MAAVTFTNARPMTPVGYENIGRTDSGLLAVTLPGQLLLEGTTGWALAPGGTTLADGIALQGGAIGDVIDVGLVGEMDLIGATLTAGADYFPSASVAGGLDSTVISGINPQMHATKVGKRVILRYCFI